MMDLDQFNAIKGALSTIQAQVGELYAKVPRFELALLRYGRAQDDHENRLNSQERRITQLESWQRDEFQKRPTPVDGIPVFVESRETPSLKRAKELASIPPKRMRGQLDSSHDLVEAAGKAVAEQIEAEAIDPATPAPTTEIMEQISKRTIRDVVMRIKEASLTEIELERIRSDRKLWAAVIIAAISSITALVEHFTR
jgi:hypothetical protein